MSLTGNKADLVESRMVTAEATKEKSQSAHWRLSSLLASQGSFARSSHSARTSALHICKSFAGPFIIEQVSSSAGRSLFPTQALSYAEKLVEIFLIECYNCISDHQEFKSTDLFYSHYDGGGTCCGQHVCCQRDWKVIRKPFTQKRLGLAILTQKKDRGDSLSVLNKKVHGAKRVTLQSMPHDPKLKALDFQVKLKDVGFYT
ncbi:hypothetical protein KSP40_PGU022419 [Platanthera guangdongensis]|uniref:Uncharacterized protein n=1 Tax=Platanthera guangdongensis TaxID=2320717 RepID=A0ABR2MSN6_9ASPA